MSGLRIELAKHGLMSTSAYAVGTDEYRFATGFLDRLWLRARMYPGFGLQIIRESMSANTAEISVVTTNPFFAPALSTASLSRRGSKVVQLLWDLFPDALIEAGVIGKHTISARLLGGMTRRALERCDATVFLGDHLKSYAESIYGPAKHGVVIPVGADAEPFLSNMPELLDPSVALKILYCGNMGKMHDVETIAGALMKLSSSKSGGVAKFYGTGEGLVRMRGTAAAMRGSMLVQVGPSLMDDEWIREMKEASIALVTMNQGSEHVVMPSKTYSALVAGQAVLAVCPRKSDLADLVQRHNCGWVIEPGDVNGLTDLIEYLTTAPGEVLEKRLNAFSAGHNIYSAKVVAKQWVNLFEDIRQG
ncbi:hypothetical protein SBP18_06325 [Rhodoferax ferrireducens]|uniref:hypothetical protein n=1 Tax=Rhodoferax ferrireducens TaxID=192843 RepID=UPI00298D7CBC|nr:hypothetical protein [Rhodoferax ferrireducens]WPC68126.1 hypothetical protein SBP18_06325 [Rhodoferax ferrireducens]